MTKITRTIIKIATGIITVIVLFVLVVIINLILVVKNESIISQGQPIENYTDHHSALLVIDIQEATTGDVSAYPYFKENSEILIQQINSTIELFRTMNLPVVYVRSEITNPLINLINNTYAKGSPGVKNDKRMNVVSNLEVVKKGKDSFRNTNLDSILIANKVNELYVAGLDAAECVNATVEAAQNRGYRVNLIREAVISKSKELMDSMMVCFVERGARVIHADSLNITR